MAKNVCTSFMDGPKMERKCNFWLHRIFRILLLFGFKHQKAHRKRFNMPYYLAENKEYLKNSKPFTFKEKIIFTSL